MKSNKEDKKHKTIFDNDTNIRQLLENYRNYEDFDENKKIVFSKNIEKTELINDSILEFDKNNKNEEVRNINKFATFPNNIINTEELSDPILQSNKKNKVKKVRQIKNNKSNLSKFKIITKLKSLRFRDSALNFTNGCKNFIFKMANKNKSDDNKNYIYKLYNILKKFKVNELSFKALVVVVMLLLIGNSVFAWFYNEYVSKGTFFGIGNIDCEINQYDNAGTFLGDIDDVATTIYETNLGVTSRNSKFIEIENIGSLDIAYNITFQLDGTVANAGVMYYRFYDVTDSVKTYAITPEYDSKLKAYAAANPLDESVEFDSSQPVSNLSIIGNSIKNGIIELDAEFTENNKRYYRLDYGMYSTANTALYNGQTLSVHTNVYVTQVGAEIDGPLEGEVWQVGSELQFRNAISNAVPGDTVKLTSNINVDGSVNISRRLNIDTNGYKLAITGDLVYDFVEFGELIINTIGTGQIDIGNELFINTPKSKIHFLGQNGVYDIFVGDKITLNGLQNEEEDGVLLDNVRIISNKIGNIPADLHIMSNTRLTIAPNVDVGNVVAEPNATNIEILNNGSIVQVQFQDMRLLDSFTKPQIYIYNLNIIRGIEGGSSIVLPTTATPYLGPNNGNTLIVKGVASNDITVSGSESFGQADISYTDIIDSVVPIIGETNSYIVYIRNADDTIRDLLIEYFTEGQSPDVMQSIADIKKIVVYTVNANYMENTNFTFLKSSEIPQLEYLDIANARVKDDSVLDRIPANALSNKASLKTIILPKTLVEIGASAFENDTLGTIPSEPTDKFNFVSIPETVTLIETLAFTDSKYINFEGLNPPEVASQVFDNSVNGVRYFVPESSIELYRNTTNISNEYVHRTSNLSDLRNYFIYNTIDGVGISLFVSEISVGSLFTVPNNIMYNNQQYNINELGYSSFRDLITPISGTTVIISDNIKTIKNYAFYDRNIIGINLQNVNVIGDYSFYNTEIENLYGNNITSIGNSAFETTTLKYVTLDNIINLGNNAFKDSLSLYEINLGKVEVIGDRALFNCPQLGKVYFNNTTTRTINNAEVVNLTVGDTAVFSGWGQYLDGRLRIYVPNGTSTEGNTILSLYKDLFSSNEQYIYTTGSITGSYYHVAIPYDFGEYTVKEVNLTDYYDNNVNGWEIVSYQGADLTSSYNIPTTFTINEVTKDVISIGDNAYRNSTVTLNNTVNISNPNIVNIGKKAFYGLKINSIITPKVKIIGDNAFTATKLTKAEFDNLYSIGNEAFYNLSTLYSLNIGKASVIGQNAIANNINLEQLFFDCNDVNNMTIDEINFSNIGINSSKRFRIYVPNDQASIDFYKALLPLYQQYVYESGIIIGSYINTPIPYDIGEYSIKVVDILNSNGVNVNGWEIIEYHGQNLQSGYVFPTEINVESLSLNVISVGDNAFIHTTLDTGLSVDINSNYLLNIGDNAFKGTEGINSIIANSLVTLGNNAFENSSLTNASFDNLNSIGEYALANMLTLYSINLGTVKNMDANSLYNLDRLEQIFFESTDLNLAFNNTAITDVGSLTNNKIRIYVTDAIAPNGKQYADVYKDLFATEYKEYFFAKGHIIGSYQQANIPWDIGIFSVRKVIKTNASAANVTGWEIIEYHGADIPSSYTLPNSLTIESETYDLISIGDYAYKFAQMIPDNSFAISHPYLLNIGNYAFNGLDGVSSVTANNVVNVGDYAFISNRLLTISFNNLSIAGQYAFAENNLLNYVNLGTITNLGNNLFENDTAIEQIYFSSTNGNVQSGTMNIVFGNYAFLNAGTQIGNRLRIYVPYGDLSGNYTYVDAYKNTMSVDFENFIYGTGTIYGSYVNSPLVYDIGEYSIKSTTKLKVDNSVATGWEIIEYHGPNLTSGYSLPTSFTADSQTMDVISIGDYAFFHTDSVGSQTWSVALGTSMVYIGDYAFNNRDISTLTGNRLSYIGKHAFENCEYLTSVIFNGVKVVDEYAFHSNMRISNVILGENIITIGDYAFYNPYYGGVGGAAGPMTNFTLSVMTAPTITANSFPAFRTVWIWKYYNHSISVPTGATGFTEPLWPDEVMERVSYVGSFSYNVINTNQIELISYTGSDTTLVIPESFNVSGNIYNVTSIGPATFDNTSNLTTITIPRYVDTIQNGFLANNNSITTINVNSNNAFYSATAGVLYNKTNTHLIKYPNRKTGSYTMLSTTKVVGIGAFSGASVITTLTIPTSVIAISSNSFDNCTTLNRINFSASVPPMLLGANIFPINSGMYLNVPNPNVAAYEGAIYYYIYRDYIS
ncbi:MAG: leucine-rich repeat protein [Clostridia bacterium]|nr:leucine-rich repeat protein [Clostridia bacterium]MDD4387066.1 leucine-rich repeat protein [Clostridia bacterium]